MAITNNDIRFLFYSRKLGVDFTNMLTLGRLSLYGTKEFIIEQCGYFGADAEAARKTEFKDHYSEPLFRFLGAAKTESMDYSNYEHATIIHDLNQPVPESLHEQFTAVVDGGTIEHVFNFPVAIAGCMQMLKKGGHYIGITPANNLMGHGFYQFSPELYYRIFSPENGFEVKKMIITAADENGRFNDWYEVSDPLTVKSRVVLTNQLPTYLMILACRKEIVPVFRNIPQQSDYSLAWAKSDAIDNGKAEVGIMKTIYRKIIPYKMRTFLNVAYRAMQKETTDTKDLGALDKKHFRKMEKL